LINRVALTSTDTKGSIVGAQATLPESLLVYNTATAGTSPTSVVPGFYYWTGSRWTKLQSTESTNNIYNTNGTLQGDRIINTADHSLSLTNSAGRPMTIIPAEASDDDAPFIFQTNNSIRFDIDSDPVLDIEHNGRVGIGTDVPQTKLHVNVSGSFYDGMRIQSASFEGGVMTQENGNYLNFENSSPEGGHSFNFARQRRLIVNDTRILPGINAQNDNVNSLGSGVMDMGSPSQHFRRLYARGIHVNDNSATGGLNLSIGDNGDTTPTYKVTSTAIYPNSNSTKNLGTANNHWNDLFMTGEIRSAAGDPINVTLNAVPDYIFAEEAFHPANDQQKDLGRSTLRWRTLYYTNASVTSDRRLKKNILPLEKSLDVIKKLEGFQYNFKKDDERLHFGFMAQDLQKILPNLVFVGDDKDKTLGLNYTELIPILVNAIKEQQQIIENQSSKLDDLEASINEIKGMLTKNALKGSYAEN
ncbi:MAG: tail fiber domain-containing protein, partial [Leeuwenhoekiella sp.]